MLQQKHRVFHILPCHLMPLLLGLSTHSARTLKSLAFPCLLLTPLWAPQPHQDNIPELPCDLLLPWCPWSLHCALLVSSAAVGSNLHHTSAFYFWGLSSDPCTQAPAVGLPSPITDKSCVRSLRFLSPAYMSLRKIICLPYFTREAVAFQE